MLSDKKILFIGTVWPEPKSSAAGRRILQLIQFFQEQESTVVFACGASNMEYSENLEEMGITTAAIKANDSGFDVFIQSLQPDLVIFDRFMTEEQFGWRVGEHCPDAIRILDTEDLHFLRIARQIAFRENKEIDFFTDEARREISSIYRCDVSLIISETELELLTNQFGIDEAILHYVPFMEDLLEAGWDELPGYKQRTDFISIGNFLHPPNWDAVLHLKQNIWSQIRSALKEAQLHIYGAYSSQKVQQLHNEEDGFLIKGRAEDAFEVFSKSRILLAPIRFGAGLKGKLVDAMRWGTPFVTTEIGIEGMNNKKLDDYVANNERDFIDQAVRLYKSEQNWSVARDNGREVFENLFDKQSHTEKLLEKLEVIMNNLESHRKKNFIGSVMLQNNMQSYKYMSKWIEEKNKN